MVRTSFVSKLSAALIVWTLIGLSAAAQGKTTKPSSSHKTAPAVVNINTATNTELATLPGVGPALATRIVEYRQKNGSFKKIEDIMNVRGIGEKAFLKLKPLVSLSAPEDDGR